MYRYKVLKDNKTLYRGDSAFQAIRIARKTGGILIQNNKKINLAITIKDNDQATKTE